MLLSYFQAHILWKDNILIDRSVLIREATVVLICTPKVVRRSLIQKTNAMYTAKQVCESIHLSVSTNHTLNF